MHPPENATYPIEITVKAEGTSRLMLDGVAGWVWTGSTWVWDFTSSLSATGASKVVRFKNNTPQTIYLAWAPDRDDEDEEHVLKLVHGGLTQSLPIRVIDEDDDLQPAIKDWFYFFDWAQFD